MEKFVKLIDYLVLFGKALVHADLERLAHVRAGVLAADVGIAVDANLVAVFAAQHLINRNAIRLAGQIPQRDLDAADAAALARMIAELLHAAEQLFNIAGVFADQTALQHFRIDAVAAVAHLAQADDALIGVDLHQGTVHGRANDIRKADICNAQITGSGISVDIGGD